MERSTKRLKEQRLKDITVTSFYLHMLYGAYLDQIPLPEFLPHRKGFEIRDTVSHLAFREKKHLWEYLIKHPLSDQVFYEIENANQDDFSNDPLSIQPYLRKRRSESRDLFYFLRKVCVGFPPWLNSQLMTWGTVTSYDGLDVWEPYITNPENWPEYPQSPRTYKNPRGFMKMVRINFVRLFFGEWHALKILDDTPLDLIPGPRNTLWTITPSTQITPDQEFTFIACVKTFSSTSPTGRNQTLLNVGNYTIPQDPFVQWEIQHPYPFTLRNPVTGGFHRVHVSSIHE